MGSPISQVASSTQPQGKGFASPQPQGLDLTSAIESSRQQGGGIGQQNAVGDYSATPPMSNLSNPSMMMAPAVQPTRQGKGGSVTLPGQGGQPRMGQPNMYPNTVGQWDNASIQPQQSRNRGGKGKG